MAPEGGEPTLLCTGRVYKRHQTHTRENTCALSLSLFIFLFRTQVRVHNVLTLSRHSSLTIARAESGEHSRAFTHLYASDAGLVYGPLARTLRRVSLARMLSCTPLHRIASRAHGMRACVSTCERAVCLHARRQRHAVPHTGNPSSWDPGLASSRERAKAPRFTYIRYDTNEPQGRQVAHKTKETRERRRDSDGERSGGMG